MFCLCCKLKNYAHQQFKTCTLLFGDCSSFKKSEMIFLFISGQKDSSSKRLKVLGSEQENCGPKTQVEASSGSGTKPTEPVKDYIHVRARRGQATDSHSLAERVLF